MSYLTFNEGVFSKIKDRVSSNIDHIKKTASDITGHVLGTVKNTAIRINNLTNNAAEHIHNIGHHIGASGFEEENPTKELHKPINTDKIKDHLAKLNPKHIKDKVSSYLPESDKAKALNNLKAMGLAGSRSDIVKARNNREKLFKHK